MFVLHQCGKFLVKFFSKNLRVWAEPIKNGAFFLQSFFFALLVSKKKRYYGVLVLFFALIVAFATPSRHPERDLRRCGILIFPFFNYSSTAIKSCFLFFLLCINRIIYKNLDCKLAYIHKDFLQGVEFVDFFEIKCYNFIVLGFISYKI